MDTCSICLDDLTGLSNRLTTDCGHCFHTNCFLQNVSHNGFACPNCRNQLIEEPECEDDEEESYYDEEEDAEEAEYEEYEEAEIEAEEAENGEIDESHLLRGSRWLFRRVEDDDDEDADDDDDDDDDDDYDEYTANRMQYERGHSRYNEEDLRPISLFEIGEKMKLCGITTEDMIALIAFPHKDNAVDIAAYPHTHIEEKRRQLDNIMREIPNVIEIPSCSTTINDDIHKSCLQNNSYYADFYNKKKEMCLSELMCVDIDNENDIYKEDDIENV
jgi:hypothetical protein